MAEFKGFTHGMGIGGWLTNYKRFHVLPVERRLHLSIGDFEHFAGYINQRDVDYIASLGMDHIRLGFDQIVLEEMPGVYRKNIWRLLDDFIDWCGKAGVNIVFNLHKALGNYCDIPETITLFDSRELQERFIALWVAFEKRYSSCPEIAFELLNEVRDVEPSLWNSLAERTVRAIRAMNPTRKIIIGSTCWNSCGKLKDLKLFDDENIIYTFHFYAPFEFTHQRGVLQQGPLCYNREIPYPGDIEYYREYQRYVYNNSDSYAGFDRMDQSFLRHELQPAFDIAAAHPEKIFWCGEFGTIRHCKIEYRENYMHDVISLLKEYNISYCVWNYLSTPNDGNRFSLVDDDERRILTPRLAEIIAGK